MNKKRGRKEKELTDEQKQWIRYNLDRADLTYVNPGRIDRVYIEIENNNIAKRDIYCGICETP